MSIELKVKIKSLAAESKFIRKEELKARNCARWLAKDPGKHNTPGRDRFMKTRESLYGHRTGGVRHAARSTQLAYAFLRGKTYLATERCKQGNRPNQTEVGRMVRKYGKGTADELKAWFKTE